ncbi:MAG: ABC transporter ATP-binding protein [Planctomycetota bacterium JB042]
MSIAVTSLSRTFGSLTALSSISFRVEPGEVFGYLGPNGAGKSTTVKILLGLLEPSSGEAVVDGVDVRRDPVTVRERIGYLPEVLALYDALTPTEHLRFAGRMRRMDEATIARRGEALLETFGLADRANHPIRTFSKGMRQKVSLALAFLHRPRVLILDEPLAGLDATSALLLKDLIRGFAAKGAAVLYCSHVLDVVEKVCDRAMILNRGRTVAEGTIAALREQTKGTSLDEVFRKVAVERDPAALARQLLEALDS